MTTFGAIVMISALILVVLFARAVIVMRGEHKALRGSEPGRGHHTIDSSYFSGGGGGGHQSSFRVPRDPQEYAKGFVPRQKGKQK
jgi:hypothetical protein